MKGLIWEVTVASKNPLFWGERSTYMIGGSDCQVAARKGIKVARENLMRAPRVVQVRLVADVDA